MEDVYTPSTPLPDEHSVREWLEHPQMFDTKVYVMYGAMAHAGWNLETVIQRNDMVEAIVKYLESPA
jgi:hypothetical protein